MVRKLGVLVVAGALALGCTEGNKNEPDDLEAGPIRIIGAAVIPDESRCIAVYSLVNPRGREEEPWFYEGKACNADQLFQVILQEWP